MQGLAQGGHEVLGLFGLEGGLRLGLGGVVRSSHQQVRTAPHTQIERECVCMYILGMGVKIKIAECGRRKMKIADN